MMMRGGWQGGYRKKESKWLSIHPSIYLFDYLYWIFEFYSILFCPDNDTISKTKNTKIGSSKCMYVFVHWFFANIWLVDIFFNSIQFNAMDDCTAMMMMRGWIENKAKNENLIDSMFREREREKMINFFSKNQNNDYDLWWKKYSNLFVLFRFNKRHLGIKGFFWL